MHQMGVNKTVSFNDLADLNRRRLLLTTFVFLIIAFAYGIVANIIVTQSLWAIVGFSVSLLATAAGLTYYLLSKRAYASSIIAVVIVIATYLIYLEISISAAFVLYFFPITIIIAFYLMGRRSGMIISISILVATILYITLRPGVWGQVVFDESALANFVISSTASVALILLYESTLIEAHDKLIRSNRMLEVMSVTDALTGLNNRKWIDEELAKRLENAKKGRKFSIFVIDFDDFKHINDEFGHIAGDQALQSFADLMRLGNSYKVGRWGGEEFICFCDANTIEEAVECAEKIRYLVADSILFVNKKITISIGVAVYETGDTAITILNRADKGVYKAKAEGKNRVCHIDISSIKKTKLKN